MAQEKRENPLTVRISEKTREDIKQAAQAQGITPNKFAANALKVAVLAAQQKQ
jgi:predicted HicB family RNase H-like nuclease